jgi:hypothetical protein
MIEIRSYRRVFDLERRVYSVDRLRLNPGGVPVRGVVYLLALLALVLVAAKLPLAGTLVRLLPWYLRDLALPGLSATVLSVIRLEGRTFHLTAQALLRYRIEPRRLLGTDRRAPSRPCWTPGEVVILPDGSDGRLRRLRYTGPGAVLIAVEHERGGRTVERGHSGVARRGRRRATLVISGSPAARRLDPGEVISLSDGATLLVRPGSRERA